MTAASKIVYFEVQKYFAGGYAFNWSEEVIVISKSKILYHGHLLSRILMVKKLLERFMKKNCKIIIKKNLG